MKIWIDTEFTDFTNCDLISLGMVAQDGQEFYGENLDYNQQWASDFVKVNIIPLCNFNKHGMRRHELGARAWEWIDSLPCDHVTIVVDYDTDYHLLLQSLGDNHPKITAVEHILRQITIDALEKSNARALDFSTVYHDIRCRFDAQFTMHFLETKETQHHALSDARANKRGSEAVAKMLWNNE